MTTPYTPDPGDPDAAASAYAKRQARRRRWLFAGLAALGLALCALLLIGHDPYTDSSYWASGGRAFVLGLAGFGLVGWLLWRYNARRNNARTGGKP